MRTRTALPVAVVLALATPIATWWLIGDQYDEPMPPGRKPDYAFRPFPLDPGVERAIGIGSVVLVAITAAWLIVASAKRRFDRRWWSVLGPVLVAGAVVGDAWRIMTAGTIGANIGAGFAVMIGGPVVAGLLLYAGFRARRLRSSRPD